MGTKPVRKRKYLKKLKTKKNYFTPVSGVDISGSSSMAQTINIK